VRLPLYQLDAFAIPGLAFSGNPAGVCPLERWIDDRLMQSIAAENNVAETAFFVPDGDGFALRWFSPAVEIELCGHATLATAWVIFNRIDRKRERVSFESKGGRLTVTKAAEDRLELDFPALPGRPGDQAPAIADAIGIAPREVLEAQDMMAVVDDEAQVTALQPRMDLIAALDTRGLIVTAPGKRVDYVSRFFGPQVGIPEDPATGSSQCTLVPYWAKRLGRPTLRALQLSARGAEFHCAHRADRVGIAGRVVPYLEGTIEV
jgi:PhzF family phenazine biosynthesis protein